MSEEQNVVSQHTLILKELSDIKTGLAVNTTETSNIKESIGEIKMNIKEIKSDFVSRREFNEGLTVINEQISPLRKIVYGMVGLMGVSVVGAILNLVLKK